MTFYVKGIQAYCTLYIQRGIHTYYFVVIGTADDQLMWIGDTKYKNIQRVDTFTR